MSDFERKCAELEVLITKRNARKLKKTPELTDPTKPHAINYNPDPAYLRELLRIAGLTQELAAARIGIGARTLRNYLAVGSDHQDAPYSVQYALERMVNTNESIERSSMEVNIVGNVIKITYVLDARYNDGSIVLMTNQGSHPIEIGGLTEAQIAYMNLQLNQKIGVTLSFDQRD